MELVSKNRQKLEKIQLSSSFDNIILPPSLHSISPLASVLASKHTSYLRLPQPLNKNSKSTLPPIDHKSESTKDKQIDKTPNQLMAHLKLKSTSTKFLGKSDSLCFSSSISALKLPDKYHLNMSLDDRSSLKSSKRLQSVETGEFTPTFRNIQCESDERPGKRNKNIEMDRLEVLRGEEGSKASQGCLIEMSSHFANRARNVNRLLSIVGPAHKTVKKIRVLQHKFPKDMFGSNNQ